MELPNKFVRWMDKDQGYDPKTTKMYERMTRKFLEWLNKEGETITHFSDLNAGSVRNYRNYLIIDRGLKASSVNKSLQSIRVMCEWARQNGDIDSNPARKIPYIEEAMLAPKSLDIRQSAELRTLINIKPLRTQVIVELGLSAGLRVSESVCIRINDITFERGKAYIRVRFGKGGKYRTVPASKHLATLLKLYNENHQEKDDFLLVNEDGSQMSIRMIQKIMAQLKKTLDYPITYHILRHTFCSDLLNSGAKLTDVAVMAGHIRKNGMPNIMTTARYVLSRPDQLMAAVQQMEKWRRKNQSTNADSFKG
ncbi:Site-specific recombinase XerD [Candidatus Desulfosporosinus infrequens]|uniref:Site-specific recombinase XerD n=1 Tax=Candidatus Desulfosporosinus infrequens TaxID=2043169 RepID=A0A2U3KUU5_9FIRM|nr:Site-specific recombinase XerD [Candidatus Desulfosporosinus infrequens]